MTVASTRPFEHSVATRSDSAIGNPAPSVITYTRRPSGRAARNAAATAGSWLCSAATTIGIPSTDSTSASASSCSSVLPTSDWMLV